MDRTLKIGLDAKRAYHNRRGLGNYSRDVIRLLTMYAPDNDYYLFAVPTADYSFEHTHTVSPQGFWRFVPSLWRSRGCIKQMQGLDTYFGLSGELPLGIHKLPLRTIVTMHDAIFVRYPELYSGTYRRIFTRKVQYACDIADTIIAISEQTKRDLIDFFHADENKIQVVYQGCSNIFRQKVNKEQLLYVKLKYNLPDTYILNVGALEPRKNLKNLVLALASLLPNIDIPIVAVGGRTDYTAEVEALAKTVGVHLQCVSGADFVDFPAIYKGATLFCYPSIFEGFGIPILEAMCVGVPVLTSTGSCFAETGGDAALYADPADTNDIAQRLTDIIGNRNMQKEMVEKGFKQAQKFADDQVAHNLCRVVLSR